MMAVHIADMADLGWEWTGTALDGEPMGSVGFRDGCGNGDEVAGDTAAHATAEAAAKVLGIDEADWSEAGFAPLGWGAKLLAITCQVVVEPG